MTILAFWKVGDLDFERHTFDCMTHEDAFRILWENREKIDAKFYDVESFTLDDAYGLHQYMGNADDLETDYNDELLDGGHWCKALLIPSDDVRVILGIEEG